MILGITGTPGTGKKTVGRFVSKMLGARFLDTTEFAIERGLVVKEGNEYVVKPRALRRALLEELKKGDFVVVGHLLPDLLKDGEAEFIAVLRLSPYELLRRYRGRGYDALKSKENLTVEALDLILVKALRRFGKRRVSEIDTTGKSPQAVAKEVVRAYRGERRVGIVDWLSLIGSPEELKKLLV